MNSQYFLDSFSLRHYDALRTKIDSPLNEASMSLLKNVTNNFTKKKFFFERYDENCYRSAEADLGLLQHPR